MPDLQVFVIKKYELRGWIRALEWILGETRVDARSPVSADLEPRSDHVE